MGTFAPQDNVMLNPFAALIERLDRIEAAIALLSKQNSEPPPIKKFLSSREVCDLLKISSPTRIALAKSGRLIPMRVGRKLLYSQDALDQALKHYSKWDRR